MTEAVKRRSLAIIEALNRSSEECDYLSEELVQMLIRGDENRTIAPQVRCSVDSIRRAADDIRNSLPTIEQYVNRRQETHRL